MKTKIISLFTVGLCLLGLIVLPACRQLDTTGVYQGDQELYTADLAITTSYDLLDTFVTWEKANRPALAAYPEITSAANAVRKNAKQWIGTATALRDSYKASPTDANKAALETSLDVLRTALSQATTYMAQAATPPKKAAAPPATISPSALVPK